LATILRFCKRWVPFLAVLIVSSATAASDSPQTMTGHAGLMYIGTLDHKILIIDQDKEEVVGEIPLTGIARSTALSADQKQLYIINTKMTIEIVDLEARKVVGTIDLAEPGSRPRITATTRNWLVGGANGRFSGLAVDPTGHYLYTTLRVVTKEIDQYRLDPPKFVAIDVQNRTIAKTFDFPKGFDQGFGFNASYKVSPDGKMLYVFDEDVLIFDLDTFSLVGRIPLSKPPYPGASPYRLTVTDDPFDDKTRVTSVYTAVDSIVHKGTLGLASLNLLTKEVQYTPIGPALPMLGFLVSPDRKRGYSVMFTGAGANREVEWWVWDLENHKVIKKEPFEARPTFRFAVSSDGKKLYLYGAGSSLEIFDAETLKSRKLIFLNKDVTTNLVTPKPTGGD
jgi:DNA-binding beta-propeller fold protein YncE